MADTIDFPEFRAAVVFDAEGGRVAEFAFEKGSLGLPEAIPQAEGITRDGQGRLFICSEPNVVYRFKPYVGCHGD